MITQKAPFVSKKNRHHTPNEELAELRSKVAEQEQELHHLRSEVERLTPEPKEREVKKHLRCPLCWEGRGGRAKREKWRRQVSGPLQKRCYACNECGCEWVVEVRCEVVDDIQYTETQLSEVRKP